MTPGLPEDSHGYFRQTDSGLHDLLKGEQVPLVLAGVEAALRFSRQVDTYPGLLDQDIAGSPLLLLASHNIARLFGMRRSSRVSFANPGLPVCP